jgi:phosphoadenosine phosphosulfate reductase
VRDVSIVDRSGTGNATETETPIRSFTSSNGARMSLNGTHRVDHSDEELAEISAGFESKSALRIIEWAVESFGHHLAMTASMTDAVLIDLATKVNPAIEVIFIDTGYHFPETLETVEAVRRHYGLNLRMMTVARQNEELWQVDPENCCSAVKVGQLDRALASKDAWMSGLRRDEADTRAKAPIVTRDLRGLVKVNPIATWTDQDVAEYIERNDIIVNPLTLQGYPSIGCMPCTSPVAEGEDPRAGRWRHSSKTECGLHLS